LDRESPIAVRSKPGRYNVDVLKLRSYEPSDFDRLLEIDQACFVDGIAYDEEEMRHFLAMPSGIVLLAEEKGTVNGFIIADKLRPRRASRAMGRIITIDVAPNAQNRGVGGLLLAEAEEELKRRGCAHVALEVAIDNGSALRFYKKHGYSVLKVLPRYYMGTVDGLLMAKPL
jgi:ribosomal-protein-alanine N-acetyltransferase